MTMCIDADQIACAEKPARRCISIRHRIKYFDFAQCANKWAGNINKNVVMPMKNILRLVLMVVVSAAALCVNVPVSRAFEHGHLCAVTDNGNGNTYWDCQYNSLEECVPNVLSGNRGFCNVNPAFGLYAAKPTARRKHRKWY